MSRHKKTSAAERAVLETAVEASAAKRQQTGPSPDPPKPNRLLLAVTGVLLVAWILFLIVLAVAA
ncbi:MAG: hypothetical protein GXY83_12550 [Rhodopirellula sp.]|nr:hypothetical protein [Rhodopirellula sp.]